MMATLMLSQGVPMMVSGDECRRTQGGNNNAYCQDNEISWFDWKLVDKHADLLRFVRTLIQFRRQEPTVRRTTFLRGEPALPGALPDVSWFSADGKSFDWHQNDHSLIVLLGAPKAGGGSAGRNVLMLVHGGFAPREFELPTVARNFTWRMFFDTAAASPKDIYPACDGPTLPRSGKLTLQERSMVCYVSNS
jgi:glycogen operon protein